MDAFDFFVQMGLMGQPRFFLIMFRFFRNADICNNDYNDAY